MRVVSVEESQASAEMARMCLCEAGLPEVAATVRSYSAEELAATPGLAMSVGVVFAKTHREVLVKARMLRDLHMFGPDHATVCLDHNSKGAKAWDECAKVRVSDGLLGFTCSERPAWEC